MNRRPPSSSLPSLPKLIDGFLQYKAAEGLSSRTIDSYKRLLAQWTEHVGAIDAGKVTSRDLIAYITYMRDEYIPRRITGNNEEKLSTKSIRNIYVGLSAFFHWLSDEFGLPNPIKGVPAPKFTSPEVDPYTKQEIEAMLKACDYKTEAETDRRKKFVMRRASANRDRGLILTLLDTGLRASELCSLRIGDMDVKTGKVTVRHGVSGGAKGGKARFVYLGKAARRAIWRYLTEREDGSDPERPLFVSKTDQPMNRDSLRQLINDIGKKAGVSHAYTHRFRHSFAIWFLRSGGDIFTLKFILGHNSLEMVQRYARIADVDAEQAHRKASPADNWRL